MKRVVDLAILFFLLLIPCLLLSRVTGLPPSDTGVDGPPLDSLNQKLQATLPYRERLRQLELDIKYAGGMKEQNDIFISKNGLMKNIAPPDDEKTRANIDAVIQVAEESRATVYVALIPTACAVKQQDLPQFAEIYNQKEYMEVVYGELSGHVILCDTYPLLFSKREEYIYYRTEENLTALGGYYVYTVMGERLGHEIHPLSEFDVEYAYQNFTGKTYDISPYKDVPLDRIDLFHYNQYPRSYKIDHYYEGATKRYYDLYPRHLLNLRRKLDVYLGGLSGVVEIQTTAPYRGKLLVFGDDTAIGYLPFLATHYEQVTFVNLFDITGEDYDKIDLDAYEQVMFAYGTENFMQYDIPVRAVFFLD